MLIEMHCHTSRHSPCSIIDPARLVKLLLDKGLSGVIFTEHHYLWTEAELSDLRRKTGAPDSFAILSGQEIGTDAGHVLVYGADRTIEENMTLEELREKFPDSALVWAHPFRWGKRPFDGELKNPIIDAVEILNSNQSHDENSLGIAAWQRLKFKAVSGSDTHAEGQAGVYPALFENHVKTIDDVVLEIKKGRCHPYGGL